MTEWRNRIIGLEWKPANQLLANAKNPRRHGARQRESIKGMLDNIGWIDVIIENQRTGEMLDGHARVEEALTIDENMPLPVLLVDIDESEQDIVVGFLDWITQQAQYDNNSLKILLDDIRRMNQDNPIPLQLLSNDIASENELDWIWNGTALETTKQVDTRSIILHNKRKMAQLLKRQRLQDFLQELPQPGESLHIVSNGSFDYFTFVPVVLDLLPQHYSAQFYGSTWTMSRNNVTDLFNLFDSGKMGTINIMTGLYFKRRESAVYATLLDGIQKRKQRYIAFENHAKVMLFNHHDHYIVIEGSANFTANPRLEQNVIVNDKSLWQFHRMWMEEMYNG